MDAFDLLRVIEGQTCKDLQAQTGTPKRTLLRNLRQLRDGGYVTATPRGRFTIYQRTAEGDAIAASKLDTLSLSLRSRAISPRDTTDVARSGARPPSEARIKIRDSTGATPITSSRSTSSSPISISTYEEGNTPTVSRDRKWHQSGAGPDRSSSRTSVAGSRPLVNGSNNGDNEELTNDSPRTEVVPADEFLMEIEAILAGRDTSADHT